MFIGAGSLVRAGITLAKPLPPTTYGVVAAASAVDEGSSIDFTITTTGVANGTALYWRIGSYIGCSESDFDATYGTVIINSGTATFTIYVTADQTTDPNESFNAVVCTDASRLNVVASSAFVNINDTSVTVSYTLATFGAVSSINEGEQLSFTVTTAGVPDGTTLYWTTGSTGSYALDTSRFSPSYYGSFQVNGNYGSFNITISADSTTATGSQSYNVVLATSLSPPNLVGNTVGITVNDTSQQAVHGSVVFDGWQDYIEATLDTYIWNLGTTWTIEYWSKATQSSVAALYPVVCQYPDTGSIDVSYFGGSIQLGNGVATAQEPTPGVWTHVAIVNNAGSLALYYDGTQQYLAVSSGYNLTDTTHTLCIGTRGFEQYNQYFPGKITNLAITSTAKYLTNFEPDVLPSSATTFLWRPTNQNQTTNESGYNSLTKYNQATYSSDYPIAITPQSYDLSSTPALTMSPGYTFGTNAFTIQGWAKFGGTIAGGLASSNGTANALACGFANSANFLIYRIGDTVTGNFTIAPALNTDVWHHFALVRDGLGQLALFINGVKMAYDGSHNYNYSGNTDYLLSAVGGIGAWDGGKLADFQISNTALYDPTAPTVSIPSRRLGAVKGQTEILLDGVTSITTDAANKQTVVKTNGTVTLDADFPSHLHSLVVTQFSGNDGSQIMITDTAGADAIPVGALMELNGIYRRVTAVITDFLGTGHVACYVTPQPDSGMPGFHANTNYTFTWYT